MKDYSGRYRTLNKIVFADWGYFTVIRQPNGNYAMNWDRTPHYYNGSRPYIMTRDYLLNKIHDGPDSWVAVCPAYLALPLGA